MPSFMDNWLLLLDRYDGVGRPRTLSPHQIDGGFVPGTKFSPPYLPGTRRPVNRGTPESASGGFGSGAMDIASFGYLGDIGGGRKESGDDSLFDILFGLGLSQQGIGEVDSNLFSGIEV